AKDMTGIGLAYRKGISTGYCNEPMRQSQSFKKRDCQPFLLVCAYSKSHASVFQPVQSVAETRIRAAFTRHFVSVMVQETFKQRIDPGIVQFLSTQFECPADHHACALSDKMVQIGIGDGCKSCSGNRLVEA